MVPAAFAVVSTHQPALSQHGYGLFSLCVIHKEGLNPISGEIIRLMSTEILSSYLYGQQHITLYNFSSILALKPLK
jgi:hypothetical protein